MRKVFFFITTLEYFDVYTQGTLLFRVDADSEFSLYGWTVDVCLASSPGRDAHCNHNPKGQRQSICDRFGLK